MRNHSYFSILCGTPPLRQKPMDDLIPDFLIETAECLHQLDSDLLALAQNPADTELLSAVFRHLHTIKGNCGFVNFTRLQKISHHTESVIGCFRDDGLAITPSRVGLILEAIDRMRVLLSYIATHATEPEGGDDDLLARLDAACAGHEPQTSDLPSLHFIHTPPTEASGLQPISRAWARLPYIVRSLSTELDKKIDLVMTGEDTHLDTHVLDLIKAPLTHMIRNSGDHGIEPPAERLKAGKPETGTIRVHATSHDNHILMEIADDGRGIDLERVKEKILEKGLATPAQLAIMSQQDIQQYIFYAGFSTATSVNAYSGRGVGMDIVRSNIEELGGSIELNSVAGQGSTFNIKIPLHTASTPQVKS